MDQPIEIRRNQRLNAALGMIAALTAIAYLQRAAGSGRVLDWSLCVLMLIIGASQLLALLDSRTPLLITDEHGVRVRLGQEWLGLPWAMIEEVRVERRDTAVRDGRLVVRARDLDAALEALLPSSRRAARWQARMHGAPLTVPLSIATRTSADRIVPHLRSLAAGRTEVVTATRGPAAVVRERPEAASPQPDSSQAQAQSPATDSSTPEPSTPPAPPAPPVAAAPVAAVRAARKVARAEVISQRQRPRAEAQVPLPAPAAATATPRATPSRPVIGPVVRAARERAGLDVAELSERTRIRPHVLEGIEIDDFGPCGGDFYARGHLRTLARYLGLDAGALVGEYDDRYAHAPITASRVFEAELASGMSGGIRTTTGGPRWGLVAAAVLALLMVWGVARYFSAEPAQVAAPITSNSAGLAANTHPITSPLTKIRTLTIHAVGAPAKVVVRDRFGKLLWSGTVPAGARHGVAGVPPFKVRTTNAAATTLRLGKHDLGPVSDLPGTAVRVVG